MRLHSLLVVSSLVACNSVGVVAPGDCDAQNNCTPCVATAEICDGVDNDCDGELDNVVDITVDCAARHPAASGVTTWACGDGACEATQCESGRSDDDGEPDNGCETTCVPSGAEVCDALDVDEDCDGTVNVAGSGGCTTYYADRDADGFGDTDSACLCAPAAPYIVSTATDCDDTSAAVRPQATELPADGIDQNCDGTELCFADGDDDGFRANPTATVSSPNLSCTDLGEAVGADPTDDCNDGEAAISPGASEAPDDSVDQDCDGTELCYVDADGDGHRDGAGTVVVSTDLDCTGLGEATAALPADDCDDAASTCLDSCVDDSDGDLIPDCRDGCRDVDEDTFGEPWYAGTCVGSNCSVLCAGGDDCDDEASTCTTSCTDLADADGTPDCADGCVDLDADGYGSPSYTGTCVGDACSPACGNGSTDCDDTASTCDADCLTDGDGDLIPDCRDGCRDNDGDGRGAAWYGGSCNGSGCSSACASGADCDDNASTCTTDCTTNGDGDAVPNCRDGCRDDDGDGRGGTWYAGTCNGTACSAACTGGSDCDDTATTCTTSCATNNDGDGIPDCRDGCVDSDGDGYGGAGFGGGCSGTGCTAACANGTSDCDNNASTCVADCTTNVDLDFVPDCRDGCIEVDGDNRGPSGYGGACTGSQCVAACSGGTTDCDPYDARAYATLTGYVDADLDDFGAGAQTTACGATVLPVGYALVGGDCDDTNGLRYPTAPEIPGDGLDENCDTTDPVLDTTTAVYVDGSCAGTCNLGTPAAPFTTLSAGIAAAQATVPNKVVVIAQGTYDEGGTVFALTTSLLGGRQSGTWTRNPTLYQTIITSSGTNTVSYLLPALGSVALDGVTLRNTGGGPATVQHPGSGLPSLLIRDSLIEGASAGSALAGTSGGHIIARDSRFYSIAGVATSSTAISLRPQTSAPVYLGLDGCAVIGLGAAVPANRIGIVLGPMLGASTARAAIVDSVISGSSATATATGLRVQGIFGLADSAVLVQRSDITGGAGAATLTGVSALSSRLVIIDSVVSGGVPSISAAGLVQAVSAVSSSSVLAVNSRFLGVTSTSPNAQVTVFSVSGTTRLLHNVFAPGEALGGAVLAELNSGIGIIGNNVFVGDPVSTSSPLYSNFAPVVLFNNDFRNYLCAVTAGFFDCVTAIDGPTTPSVNGCDWSGCLSSSGNVDIDPQLAADNIHRTGNNLRDLGGNPGSYYTGPLDDLDVDGAARPQGAASDIGPDEAP